MLSKRELLLATIAHEPTPRAPIALWRHWPVEDHSAEDLALATLDFQARFDFDFIKLTPSQVFVAEDAGLRGVYDGNPEGDLVKGPRPITTLEQWEAIEPGDLETGALARQLRCVALTVAGANETPVIQTIFNPLTVAACLAGTQATIWRRRHPEIFRRGFDTVIATWRAFVAAAIGAGAAGIFFSTADATYASMDEEEYRCWGRPSDLAVLEAAGTGWFNLLHVHGSDLMFDLVADYPVHAVNWDDRRAGPSLRVARPLVRGAVAGGLAQWDELLTGSADAVRTQVDEALAQTGGVGTIIAPGCVMPIPTPERNIRAAIAAARESVRS